MLEINIVMKFHLKTTQPRQLLVYKTKILPEAEIF
jgi:hypothetical protein